MARKIYALFRGITKIRAKHPRCLMALKINLDVANLLHARPVLSKRWHSLAKCCGRTQNDHDERK